MAIFLALRSPELKVEAITPVSGNVPLDLTLPNALRLLEIAKRRDIPVAAGASHPLVRRLATAGHVHGVNGLAGIPGSVSMMMRRVFPGADASADECDLRGLGGVVDSLANSETRFGSSRTSSADLTLGPRAFRCCLQFRKVVRGILASKALDIGIVR
jgi:hypothetical protein